MSRRRLLLTTKNCWEPELENYVELEISGNKEFYIPEIISNLSSGGNFEILKNGKAYKKGEINNRFTLPFNNENILRIEALKGRNNSYMLVGQNNSSIDKVQSIDFSKDENKAIKDIQLVNPNGHTKLKNLPKEMWWFKYEKYFQDFENYPLTREDVINKCRLIDDLLVLADESGESIGFLFEKCQLNNGEESKHFITKRGKEAMDKLIGKGANLNYSYREASFIENTELIETPINYNDLPTFLE